MGAYIYKAKVKPFLGAKIGIFDFWYKDHRVSYGDTTGAKQNHMRQVVMDNLRENHPGGVQFFTHAPTKYDRELRKDVWNKTERKALYWNGDNGPMVINDEGKWYDRCLNGTSVIGTVWGSKTGKMFYDIDPQTAIRAFEKQYMDKVATEDEIEKILDNHHKFREQYIIQLRQRTLEAI